MRCYRFGILVVLTLDVSDCHGSGVRNTSIERAYQSRIQLTITQFIFSRSPAIVHDTFTITASINIKHWSWRVGRDISYSYYTRGH